METPNTKHLLTLIIDYGAQKYRPDYSPNIRSSNNPSHQSAHGISGHDGGCDDGGWKRSGGNVHLHNCRCDQVKTSLDLESRAAETK